MYFFKKHMLTPSISVSEINEMDDSSSVDVFTLTRLTQWAPRNAGHVMALKDDKVVRPQRVLSINKD